MTIFFDTNVLVYAQGVDSHLVWSLDREGGL